DGNVISRLTVDRADTYDLLRRDAAGLERALQDPGLKTTDNRLQFSLRDQSANQQQTNGGADTAQLVVQDELLSAIDVTTQIYNRLAGQGGGLDIRV
ncbi:MAG: flagellar hook-length control protein FliK, partial [Pseudolabrys sp.]